MEFAQPPSPQRSIHIPLPQGHFVKWLLKIFGVLLIGFVIGIGMMMILNKKTDGPVKTITILASGNTEVAANEVTITANEYKDFSSESEAKVFSTPIIEKVKLTLNSLKIPESSYTLTSSVDGGVKYGTLMQPLQHRQCS